MKYYTIINFDIADSQLMLCKDVYDMQVIFKGKTQNSTEHIIPFLLKIYFAEGSLSKMAPGIPTCWCSHSCAVHPTLYPHWALWPTASGKKWRCVTLTLGCKRLWLPYCPPVLLYFIFFSWVICSSESKLPRCEQPYGGTPRQGMEASSQQLLRSWGLQQPCGIGRQPLPGAETNTALAGSPTATLLEDLTQKPPS